MHDGPQFAALGKREAERLVADHMDAGLEEGLGHGEMRVVARDDRDEVDALVRRQRGLALGHFLVSRVDPRRIEVEIGAGEFGFGRVGGETAGDEIDLAVEPGGHAVDRADKRAAPAADHAHAKLAIEFHNWGEEMGTLIFTDRR